MTQELSLVNNQINLDALNQATGFKTFVYPQRIKLNGEDGHFYISTDEKDANNKKILKDLGKSIDIHFILTRKQITGAWNNETEKPYPYYSQEFVDNCLVLFDENKTPVFKGLYKELRENPSFLGKIIFNNIVYCFIGDELCRLIMSGSKLNSLFEYQASFKNDNPAKYITRITSAPTTTKRKKYFIPVFTQNEAIDSQLIIKRVNSVNEYLNAYYNATHKEENNTPTSKEFSSLTENSQEQYHEEEMNVDNIPFN